MNQFSEGCQCHTLSQALTKGTPWGGKATWQFNQSLKTILIGLQKKQQVAGLHPKLISVHIFKFPHAWNHIFVFLTQIL